MRGRTLFQAFALVAAAAVAAAVSNLTASAERRLDWVRSAATTRDGGDSASAPSVAPPSSRSTAPPAVSSATPPTKAPASRPLRAEKPAAPPAPAAAPPREFPAHPDKAWLEATPEETRTLFDRGAPFFDARRSSVYRDGHIRGARSLSVWEAGLDGKLEAIAGEHLDATAPIVVYCSGGDCEDSHMLAERLWGIGLNNVLVYRDGFPDWERRGWPISKGEAP